MIKDAVVRNLKIPGEAANQIPENVGTRYSDNDWNIVIHQYFGVDYNVIWAIVEDELPELRKKLWDIMS